jgi:hypothetical protein
VVPYKNMTDMQNIDAGKEYDLERVFGSGIIPGLLWKRHAVITAVKYSDDTSELRIMALEFMSNTKYAQPLMDRKMREARNLPSLDDTQATISIADELNKHVKLKEQGAKTEEEYSQMKSNLMKRM